MTTWASTIETRDSQKAIELISSELLQKCENIEVFSILSLDITDRESLKLYKSQSLISREFQDYEKYSEFYLKLKRDAVVMTSYLSFLMNYQVTRIPN